MILPQHQASNLTIMADIFYSTLNFILWLSPLRIPHHQIAVNHATLLTHAKYSIKNLSSRRVITYFNFFYIHFPCKRCSRHTNFQEDSSVPIQIFISHSAEKTLSYIHLEKDKQPPVLPTGYHPAV